MSIKEDIAFELWAENNNWSDKRMVWDHNVSSLEKKPYFKRADKVLKTIASSLPDMSEEEIRVFQLAFYTSRHGEARANEILSYLGTEYSEAFSQAYKDKIIKELEG